MIVVVTRRVIATIDELEHSGSRGVMMPTGARRRAAVVGAPRPRRDMIADARVASLQAATKPRITVHRSMKLPICLRKVSAVGVTVHA